MTFLSSPQAVLQFVLWGGLAIGLVFGAVGQWSHFCVRGAIADWMLFRGKARAMTWLLAVAVAAAGTQALVSLGLFDATRSLAWNPRLPWLSCLLGGLVFGFGMVLSGGCPQRSLVKTGTGDLKSLVVLIVTAIAALMTLRGLFAPVRAEALDVWAATLSGPQDLGSVLGKLVPVPAAVLRWVLVTVLVAIAVLALWRNRATMERKHWIGGLVVGLLPPAAWLVTGYFGFLPEHPDTLEPAWLGTQSRRPEGLSFVAPMANSLDLLTLWTDKNTTASFGITAALGALLGSFASARARGEFRLQNFSDSGSLLKHLAGGVLMGFGGITALGCTIGQGLTGLAMLSAGAVLTVAGIVAGAIVAVRMKMHDTSRVPVQ